MTTATVDEQKLHDLLGRAIVDFGAVSTAPLVIIGDRLGLYRALASQGPLTSAELAAHTDTSERYVREWLNAQAASGYVNYDAGSGRYELTPEQHGPILGPGYEPERGREGLGGPRTRGRPPRT